MARLLQVSSLSIHIFSTTYIIFAVLAVLSIISLVSFLCASHKRQKSGVTFDKRKLELTKETLMSSFSKANSISSKALLKMISWRKHEVQHRNDDDDDDDDDVFGNHGYNSINHGFVKGGFEDEDDAVWKKTIIMGEKCRPFDFSGKIEYDSEGNLLPADKSRDGNQKMISSSKQVVVVS